mgnify:FL=1
MSYLRAEEILPRELIETIQQYVSGKSIYIPSKEKQGWGSQTDTRKKLGIRNREIYEKYLNGVPASSLAEEYFLSNKSVQRIIRSERASDQKDQTRSDER